MPHPICTRVLLKISVVLLLILNPSVPAQTRRTRPPGGGKTAVVIDERLAVLRDTPDLDANIVRRLSRGRLISVLGTRKRSDGVVFYRVAVTRRTRGWLQADSFVSPSLARDDAKLLNLIKASRGFDRIDRAAIFLAMFPGSKLRPEVLLLLGDTIEAEAPNLSSSAGRKFDERELEMTGAPIRSYFKNFTALDRYRRRGIVFVLDDTNKFHYNGAAWREIVRRYPERREATLARERLNQLVGFMKKGGQITPSTPREP